MKILFLTDITMHTGSWIGRYQPLISELSKNGNSITTLLPREDRDRISSDVQHVSKAITIEFTGKGYQTVEKRMPQSSIKLFVRALLNLTLILKSGFKGNYDLIFLAKPLPVSSIASMVLKLIKKIPVHLDCDDYEICTNQTSGKLQHEIIKLFENTLPKYCDSISTHNSFLFRRLERIKGNDKRLFFIPNGIDTERLSLKVTPLKIHDVKKINKLILYFGDLNIATGHNVDILIKALEKIVYQHNKRDVSLIIIGDGKDAGYLHEMAIDLHVNDYIHWIGRVKPDEIGGYLSVCDVVVDPVSEYPGNLSRCPLKILEAMYMGKPVVTSPVGDRRLLLEDAGIYVKAGDSGSMASGLLSILKDKGLQNELAGKLISRSERYVWSLLADRFNTIFRMIEGTH